MSTCRIAQSELRQQAVDFGVCFILKEHVTTREESGLSKGVRATKLLPCFGRAARLRSARAPLQRFASSAVEAECKRAWHRRCPVRVAPGATPIEDGKICLEC